jgi:hypothetical protein
VDTLQPIKLPPPLPKRDLLNSRGEEVEGKLMGRLDETDKRYVARGWVIIKTYLLGK